MKYIDNTSNSVTVKVSSLKPTDYIELMQKVCPDGVDHAKDTDRSEWLEYLLQASKFYDVILDKGSVVFSDKE